MGRPPLDIDPQKVQALAGIWCTNEEIAAVLGCSADTIERRFAGELEKGRATAKMSLRRKQWEVAERGSVPMLIFLGKNYLGQKDVAQLEHTAKDGAALIAAQAQEVDFSQLSLEELEQLEALRHKAQRKTITATATVVDVETNGNGQAHTNGTTNGDGST